MIKWNRSEEGCTDSKCGRFGIEPIFNHSVSAQGYNLYLLVDGRKRERIASSYTMRDTKARAERFVRIGR